MSSPSTIATSGETQSLLEQAKQSVEAASQQHEVAKTAAAEATKAATDAKAALEQKWNSLSTLYGFDRVEEVDALAKDLKDNGLNQGNAAQLKTLPAGAQLLAIMESFGIKAALGFYAPKAVCYSPRLRRCVERGGMITHFIYKNGTVRETFYSKNGDDLFKISDLATLSKTEHFFSAECPEYYVYDSRSFEHFVADNNIVIIGPKGDGRLVVASPIFTIKNASDNQSLVHTTDTLLEHLAEKHSKSPFLASKSYVEKLLLKLNGSLEALPLQPLQDYIFEAHKAQKLEEKAAEARDAETTSSVTLIRAKETYTERKDAAEKAVELLSVG